MGAWITSRFRFFQSEEDDDSDEEGTPLKRRRTEDSVRHNDY